MKESADLIDWILSGKRENPAEITQFVPKKKERGREREREREREK